MSRDVPAATIEKVVSALRVGADRGAAARYAGLDPAALAEMVARRPTIRRPVEEAEAAATVANVASIAGAAKNGDWRAAQWLIDRRTKAEESTYCGATSKRTGAPCRMRRGFRTSHPGTGNCWLHFGATPNGAKAAQREAAENVLRTLRIASTLEPIQALFEAVRVASWREAGLRQLLQHSAEPLYGPDHQGDDRPHVLATMHGEALDQLAKISKMAVDAGLDVKLVAIATRQAEITIRAVQAALDVAGIVGDLRSKAEAAAADVLEPALPAGDGLN